MASVAINAAPVQQSSHTSLQDTTAIKRNSNSPTKISKQANRVFAGGDTSHNTAATTQNSTVGVTGAGGTAAGTNEVKKVTFYANGDRFFKGKKVFVIPARYGQLDDLLGDLTNQLPTGASLPYGVRQIFTPKHGHKIKYIGQLADGESYVCAGFEQFRPIQYGVYSLQKPNEVVHAPSVMASHQPSGRCYPVRAPPDRNSSSPQQVVVSTRTHPDEARLLLGRRPPPPRATEFRVADLERLHVARAAAAARQRADDVGHFRWYDGDQQKRAYDVNDDVFMRLQVRHNVMNFDDRQQRIRDMIREQNRWRYDPYDGVAATQRSRAINKSRYDHIKSTIPPPVGVASTQPTKPAPAASTSQTRSQHQAAGVGRRADGSQHTPQRQRRTASGDKKPRLFTIVNNSVKPRRTAKILLSRPPLASYDHLLSQIQGAFGGEGGRVRRVYSLHGQEIHSIGDFFGSESSEFVALGSEKFTTSDLREVLAQLYPNSDHPKNIFKLWEQKRSKKSTGPTAPAKKSTPAVAAVSNNTSSEGQSAPATQAPPAKKEKKEREAGVAAPINEEVEPQSSPKGKEKKDKPNDAKQTSKSVADKSKDKPADDTAATVPSISSTNSVAPPPKRDASPPKAVSPTKGSESPAKSVPAQQPTTVGKSTATPAVADSGVGPTANQSLDTQEAQSKNTTAESSRARKHSVSTNDTRRSVEPAPNLVKIQEEGTKPAADEKKPDDRAGDGFLPPIVNKKTSKDVEAVSEPVTVPHTQALPSNQTTNATTTPAPTTKSRQTNIPKELQTSQDGTAIDPELMDILSAQQESGVPKALTNQYAVLPDIRKQPEGEETTSVADTPAPVPVKEDAAPETSRKRPSTKAGQVEDEMKAKAARPGDQSQASTSETASVTKATPLPGGIEHENYLRGALELPQSAPGRRVPGKLSRQISRVDYVTSRFDYGNKLGDGNFAVVKRCRKKKTGEEFAIKIIDKSKLKGKYQMVENEIRIMKSCQHRNLVRLYEMYETEKNIFLIMELVKNGDLFDAITAAVRFDERSASSMVRDIASALFYLHSRSIVHRDLKPENLMVERHSRVNPTATNTRGAAADMTLKLGDFGLAMEVKEPIYTVCGTPTYVAPEILTEQGYGLEVDCWALGVITYIFLCGFPPFRSADRKQSELFELIKSGTFHFTPPYWDNVSKSACELIKKLLNVDKRKRYTCVDVLTHTWLLSNGNTRPLPLDLAQHKRTLRKDYETDANANMSDWKKVKSSWNINMNNNNNNSNNNSKHRSMNNVSRTNGTTSTTFNGSKSKDKNGDVNSHVLGV